MIYKSFKTILKENTKAKNMDGYIDLGHGLFTFTYEDRLFGDHAGYEYVKRNWGINFNVDEQPKNVDEDSFYFFSIPFYKLRTKLTEFKSIFIDNDNRNIQQVPFYKLIHPDTRKEIQEIFDLSKEEIDLTMDDKYILRYISAEDLYLYPY